MTFQIAITLAILLLLLIALVRDWFRPHFIFVGALMALLVLGVLPPNVAFSGFSNEAVFTVAALFVVATGVQNTGAFSFMETLIFKEKSALHTVAFKMMGLTAVLSAFLNNTPIVAMLIPQVQAWADKKGVAASKLLIPLSYATIVGGTATLIGTSTNIIVSGMMRQAGLEPIGLFELSYIGIPAAILTLLWFLCAGLRWLPSDRKVQSTETPQNENDAYQFDYRVPSQSSLSGKSIEQAGLRNLQQAFLVHIQRKEHLIGVVEPDFVIEAEDILTFSGTYEAVQAIATNKGLNPAIPGANEKVKPLPLYEAVVSHSSPLVGKTLKETMFRYRFHGVVLAIKRKEEHIKGALGNTPIQAGDLLLIEAKEDFESRSGLLNRNFYLVRRKGQSLHAAGKKSTLALSIIGGMLLSVALGVFPMVTAALLAAILMIVTGCVQKDQLLNAIHPPILIVIAAAIGIGKAVEVSGAATWATEGILGTLTFSHPVFYIALLYVLTNLFTEVITNNAAAVLMLPLAIVLANQVGIPVHAAGVTVAMAASASFLTPIGYQTNLMVMSVGGYKFTDYTKAGFPITLIMMVCTVMIVWWRYL